MDLIVVITPCSSVDGSYIIDEDLNSWTNSGITNISISDLDGDGYEDILIQSGTKLIRLGNDGNDNWSSDLITSGLYNNKYYQPDTLILQSDGSHIIDEDLSNWARDGISNISISDLDGDGMKTYNTFER